MKSSECKFTYPNTTAKGEPRAFVQLEELTTLWFNTGTRCNLECSSCYIESSPRNDRYVFLTSEDIHPFLQEINSSTKIIGLTGGEPFLNPSIISILTKILDTKREILILTNGHRVLNKYFEKLIALNKAYPDKLKIRVSLDHHTKEIHEENRGERTFNSTMESMKWLFDNNLDLSIAGRSLQNETLSDAINSYQNLMIKWGINLNLDSGDSEKLIIFPELKQNEDVPEISMGCWEILNKRPQDQMCASQRMVVKLKETQQMAVLPCTLLVYDKQFELGNTIRDSRKTVFLNHQFCSKFCVLGGATCSSAK
jgi:sulfatase maturation enzyme AslB (radical SAM superfamily)